MNLTIPKIYIRLNANLVPKVHLAFKLKMLNDLVFLRFRADASTRMKQDLDRCGLNFGTMRQNFGFIIGFFVLQRNN